MPHFLLISTTTTFQAHTPPKTDIQSGFETVWRGLLLDGSASQVLLISVFHC